MAQKAEQQRLAQEQAARDELERLNAEGRRLAKRLVTRAMQLTAADLSRLELTVESTKLADGRSAWAISGFTGKEFFEGGFREDHERIYVVERFARGPDASQLQDRANVITVMNSRVVSNPWFTVEEPYPEKKDSPPTAAVEPPGPTMAKYLRLRDGMSQREVEWIVGNPGTELSRSTFADQTMTMFQWEGAGLGSSLTVTFLNGKLTAKAQFGLK